MPIHLYKFNFINNHNGLGEVVIMSSTIEHAVYKLIKYKPQLMKRVIRNIINMTKHIGTSDFTEEEYNIMNRYCETSHIKEKSILIQIIIRLSSNKLYRISIKPIPNYIC